MKNLTEYIQEKNIAETIEEVTDADLPKVLYDFYSEIEPIPKEIMVLNLTLTLILEKT